MEINNALTPDLYVSRTEDVTNGAGTTCCRFVCVYQGETMLADFSPDDEASDVSLIEAVGSGDKFTAFLNLVKTTYRDQFQAWYTLHKAQ